VSAAKRHDGNLTKKNTEGEKTGGRHIALTAEEEKEGRKAKGGGLLRTKRL